MNFEFSKKSLLWQERLKSFMASYIYPVEREYLDFVHDHNNLWQVWPGMDELKKRAREAGLWNLFLPTEYGTLSPGLSNLEYAPLAELMGRCIWSSEVFNCSAPDTGNMEVLAKYGDKKQQQQWLKPLLDGTIRSAFLMTEPGVASSDATNIETLIVPDGDDYLINGHKWWSSGAMDPRCKIFIVMGKTDPEQERHRQQSMILVPRDTEGVEIVRGLHAMGALDSPGGHAEIKLNNVRVPKANILVGEGSGFEIAQGRLGPGRIHHCMRLIGMAQKALELMCERSVSRVAFGRPLSAFSSIRQDVAKSLCEIQQARLLTLQAADQMDKKGAGGAKELISMIKIVAPLMAQRVIDRSIQAHGGLGVSMDVPLYMMQAWARIIRIADGPDEVHMYQLGRNTIRKYGHPEE